ncbi:MAG: hypothetical protein CM1200mP37_4360 [Chloroflexota bacterium]|nr:MAG: hypothetical protein CM1200mP37_4360 [Chloroflexota bacterium]
MGTNKIDNLGGQSHLSRSLRRLFRKKIAVICLVLISIIYCLGIFAPIVSPYDYSEQDYTAIRQAPSFEMNEGINGFFTKSHFAGQIEQEGMFLHGFYGEYKIR